tara:strand:+ start:1947 stop:3374 length:1428 start_codon:yes stop_codon:yes gene_type:complete
MHETQPEFDDTFTQVTEIFQQQKSNTLAFNTVAKRRHALAKLADFLNHKRDAICDAISRDYTHRSHDETLLLEILPLLNEIKHIKKNLSRWVKPRNEKLTIWHTPAKGKVIYQPLGVVGIIVPWNYPLFLALSPLIAVIAAGNRCMIKMSELTPHFNVLLKEFISEAFIPAEIAVITGDASIGKAFSELPFNHLLFTGGTEIGKQVMASAAKNLTPVTLELGGKSPVIIDPDYSVKTAAKRILHGKFLNAGQTCVAPDYVFVSQEKLKSFVAACEKYAKIYYPHLINNPDYSCIINHAHWQRLESYVKDAVDKGAEFIPLGDAIDLKTSQKFQPGLLLHVTDEMLVMQEEIFGPILPVRAMADIDEAIDYINSNPNPLALYIFTHDKTISERIIHETLSGGVAINETLLQVAENNLPFGGVGHSGIGHYRGRYGVECFSKLRPVFHQSRLRMFSLLRPPYKKRFHTVLQFMLKFL